MNPIDNDWKRKRNTKVIKFRSFPASGIIEFGNRITHEDWSFLNPEMDSTELVNLFETINGNVVEEVFPLQEMKVNGDDQQWMNVKLKKLKRQRQRVYQKQGKSEKYSRLKKEFEEEKRKAVELYKEKVIDQLKEGKRNSSYKALRRLDPEFERKKKEYCLQQHEEEGLAPEESVERIINNFISINSHQISKKNWQRLRKYHQSKNIKSTKKLNKQKNLTPG